MRDIKFRLWDKKHKMMIYFDNESLENLFALNRINKDQYEILQYTGKKDKNEKEIYEGDIVKIAYGTTYNYKPRASQWHVCNV